MRKLLFVLMATTPSAAAGQTVQTLTPYVSAGDGPDGAVLVGASLSTESGLVGLRLGGGVDARATPIAEALDRPDGSGPRPWHAELDVLLFLAPTGARPAVLPYAVAGGGMAGAAPAGRPEMVATWGYGGGARTRLTERVSLETEMRYRAPLWAGNAVAADAVTGWHYRVGLGFRLGASAAGRAVVPSPGRSAGVPGRPAGAVARSTIATGERYLGTPYVWGGSSPREGFDCSGFVQYVYRRSGVELPRVSRDQARAGTPLPADLRALEAGDLMFFATDGRVVDHVAIYTGGGRILHATASGREVRYDMLSSSRGEWYLRHFVAARRVIPTTWY